MPVILFLLPMFLYTPCWSFLTSVYRVGIVLQLIYIRGILLLSTLIPDSELANLSFFAGFGLISPLIFRDAGLVHSWINQMMPICIKYGQIFQIQPFLFWVL